MEEPLSIEEIRAYEQRLREQLASCSRIVEKIQTEALEVYGTSCLPFADEAVEESQMEEDLDALAAEDDLVYEIRDALDRIASDAYGVCERCGDWISRQRLAIVPYARRCADCAAHRRPAEASSLSVVDPC